MEQKKNAVACDSCYHYVEDEDTGEYVCEIDLGFDEDECARYDASRYKTCPYYELIVKNQGIPRKALVFYIFTYPNSSTRRQAASAATAPSAVAVVT